MLADKSAFNHEITQPWAAEGSAERSQSISQRTKRVILVHYAGNCVVDASIQKCGQPNLKAPLPFRSRARSRLRSSSVQIKIVGRHGSIGQSF